MGRRKKKQILPPRRKRMARPARLQSARHWIPKYQGKNLCRTYATWFGVDLGCALRELELLGVTLDPTYVERLRTTLRNRPSRKKPAETSTNQDDDGYAAVWDDEFACIVDFTSADFPFGTTWDELEPVALENGAAVTYTLDDGDIPF
ncbi:MAG: hypothetical protein EP329_25750 [Deltaproteobacteria bacterium]|nr:MAG: hypothetical protein EP329_25750 [Deltaproteobacteria bacterium]